MIDTHCHLQFNAYKNDYEAVIKRCADKGVILNVVGSQKDTSARAVAYAEKNKNIYATVGLHPIHLFKSHVDESEAKFDSRAEDFDYNCYKNLAQNKKVIAIGECGLDFFHQPEGMSREDVLKKQKETFLAQYELAQELDLPLVIHVRDPKPEALLRFGAGAHEEMVELLTVIASKAKQSQNNERIAASPSAPRNDNTIRGVIHCYTANWHYAQKYLDLGLHLGFTGVITFPPKKTDPQSQLDLLEVVAKCPLGRLLTETDAPYLAPQAYRGQRCEPWMVEEVIKKIAEVKGVSPEEVVAITTKNAKALFNL